VQYSYDDNSVGGRDGTYEALKGLKSARSSTTLTQASGGEGRHAGCPCGCKRQGSGPAEAGSPRDNLFSEAAVARCRRKLLSDNFYWLSTKPDTMNWAARNDTAYTPQKDFGDLTGLNALPQVKLELKADHRSEAGKGAIRLKVKNPSASVAFQVHARLTMGKGGDDLCRCSGTTTTSRCCPARKRVSARRLTRATSTGKNLLWELRATTWLRKR